MIHVVLHRLLLGLVDGAPAPEMKCSMHFTFWGRSFDAWETKAMFTPRAALLVGVLWGDDGGVGVYLWRLVGSNLRDYLHGYQ